LKGKLRLLDPRLLHPILKLLVSFAHVRVLRRVNIIRRQLLCLVLNRFVQQTIERVETFGCELSVLVLEIRPDPFIGAKVVFFELNLDFNGMTNIFKSNCCQSYVVYGFDLATQFFFRLNEFKDFFKVFEQLYEIVVIKLLISDMSILPLLISKVYRSVNLVDLLVYVSEELVDHVIDASLFSLKNFHLLPVLFDLFLDFCFELLVKLS